MPKPWHNGKWMPTVSVLMILAAGASACSAAQPAPEDLLPILATEDAGMESIPPEFSSRLDADDLNQPTRVRFLGENDTAAVWAGVDAQNHLCVYYDLVDDDGGGGSVCMPPELFAEHGSHGSSASEIGNVQRHEGYILAPEGYVLDEVPRGLEKILDNLYAGDLSRAVGPMAFRNHVTGHEITFFQ
ncbi:hypothetical protein [Glutamicibacter sp. PS]|uniref:hypothetical protein n=1 Tax=Glutamicibacter sp. PS TaxID=3075634 RepID=UPI00284CB099|nr:hypothetical protein [Glutamicibacter sp. PS]MDR4534186.1 hypothetical protein [Glutamicibacter sp. PS]